MIDPVYAALALALAAFALPGLGAGLALAMWWLLPLVFALGFVIAALFLYQALVERFGPPHEAPFLALRWAQSHPKAWRSAMRAAQQVVQLYQLSPDDLNVSAPPDASLQQLVDDALDADSRVPAIAQTPLDIDLLGRQLAIALGGEAAQQAAFGAQLVRALPMRRPQPWWRAWPMGLRRQFGRWLFSGKTHDWAADGLAQMLMLARAPGPTDWQRSRQLVVGHWLYRARLRNGLQLVPEDASNVAGELPISQQISLKLLVAVMQDASVPGLIWRHPSRHRMIRYFAQLRDQAEGGGAPALSPSLSPAPAPSSPAATPNSAVALLRRLSTPASPFVARPVAFLGGDVQLGAGQNWPTAPEGEAPLQLIAQLPCDALAALGLWGQDSGVLLFLAQAQGPTRRLLHLAEPPALASPSPASAPFWPVVPVALGPAPDAIRQALGQPPQRCPVLAQNALHPDLLATGWPWTAQVVQDMVQDLASPPAALPAADGAAMAAKIAHNARRAAARFAALAPDARIAPADRAAFLDWLNGGLRAGAAAHIETALRRATAGVLAQAQARPHAPARAALPASAMAYFAAELAQNPTLGAHLLGAAETPNALCLLSTGPELAPALPAVEFWVAKTAAKAGDCSAVGATAAAFEG